MNPAERLAVFNLPCLDHALPFRTIFREHAARHGNDWGSALLGCVQELEILTADGQPPSSNEEAIGALGALLEKQELAYQRLMDAKAGKMDAGVDLGPLEEACLKSDIPLKQLLHAMDGAALCFSGGGIRSASFCLGVLEGLARFSTGRLPSGGAIRSPGPLMTSIDYLSTVSGGGYIGSWFSAWIYRRWRTRLGPRRRRHLSRNGGNGELEEPLPSDEQKVADVVALHKSYEEVIELLAGGGSQTAGDPAPRAVRHLREYTSYLAPALGLSLDTWTLAAIVLRNLIVNWVMVLPIMLVAVCVPQVARFFMVWSRDRIAHWPPGVYYGALLFLFVVAAGCAGYFLPSHRHKKNKGLAALWVFCGFIAPLAAASWIMVVSWWGRGFHPPHLPRHIHRMALIAFCAFLLLGFFTWKSYCSRVRARQWQRSFMRKPPVVAVIMLLETAVVAALAGWLLGLLRSDLLPRIYALHRPEWLPFPADGTSLLVLLALPLVWTVLLVSSSLFSGLVGIYEMEDDREWWARAGGFMFLLMTGWISAEAVALYGNGAFHWVTTTLVGLALGGLGSGIGFSGSTSAGPRPVKVEQLTKLGSFLSKHNLLLPGLCLFALLLITLGLASVEECTRATLKEALGCNDLNSSIAFLLASGGLALAVNSAINVNLFSLHEMYRMRLMRAFLGASNTHRNPDPFTGFDSRDTPYMHALAVADGVPMHVINTTLNLVGTSNLAWRQRKAESFTFSPECCGSWRLGYVPTEIYGGAEGVTVATAMAISGAAFNPNMGYHSSPLVTLLMTLFNVRLGWWLPNPKRQGDPWWKWAAKGPDYLHKSGPTLALEPLLLGALGMTDSTFRWLELSDGGHFENLGLYEMVLRRCHSIIVVDAGADPSCQFEDLGNALRKIEIDLGIPIRFHDGIRMKPGAQAENRYCAVATIDYACADEACADEAHRAALNGTLIYIKAGINGAEPPDIHQYALTHGEFPHETTANQFFNESQFESYRHLGSHVVETIVTKGLEVTTTPGPPPFAEAGCVAGPAACRIAPAREENVPDFAELVRLARAYAMSAGGRA